MSILSPVAPHGSYGSDQNPEIMVVIHRAGPVGSVWTEGHLYGRHFDDLLLLECTKIRPQSKSDWLECVNQTMEAKKTLIRQCGVLFRPSVDIQHCDEGCCKSTKFDQFILHTFRRHDSTHGPNQILRSPTSDAVRQQSVCTPSIGPTTWTFQRLLVGDQVAACRRGTGPITPNMRRRALWLCWHHCAF